MASKEQQDELKKHIFQLRGSRLERCLWFTVDAGQPSFCENPAIRAHSVQNGAVLELLAEHGHVIAPEMRIDSDRGPQFDLKELGRNRATTFAGLCAQHDDLLFGPIEKTAIELADPEHLFLLAYRATFYELYQTMAVGASMQAVYQKRIGLGLESAAGLSPAGLLATDRLMVAYDTWMYKLLYDAAYAGRDFGAVLHEVVELDVTRPTLAASGLFSIGSDKDNSLVGVCITVLPFSYRRTVVIISYLPRHRRRVRHELYSLLRSRGETQKLEISRRLLNECSNFVLAPSFVRSWTPERRDRILDLFVRTMFRNDFTASHADLSLFG